MESLHNENHNGFGFADQKNKIMRRRKQKKVQSAKISSLKGLQERNSDRMRKGRGGDEWVRVLSPPKTDISTNCGVDNDNKYTDEEKDVENQDQVSEEDDELIKRYFSGISSAGSSISWAEDAMESEFTTQLMKLWEDIESVCAGGERPEKMSDIVYDECLQWKRAFPNPNNHRFLSRYQNDGDSDISPIKSPTLLDDTIGNDDSSYSLLVNSPFSFTNGLNQSHRNDDDENMQLLQANFRELNCATPRPNIRKATEYVNAWLSECQNSSPSLSTSFHVPATDDNADYRNLDFLQESDSDFSLRKSPFKSTFNASNNDKPNTANIGIGYRSHLSNIQRLKSPSIYAHSKFMGDSENDKDKFFTLPAATSKEEQHLSGRTAPINLDYGINRGGGFNGFTELSEFPEEGGRRSESPIADSDTLADMVSRRSNFRVQRPISSRIRDHTITPIATGSTLISSSSYGHRGFMTNNILNNAKDNGSRYRDRDRDYNSSIQMFPPLSVSDSFPPLNMGNKDNATSPTSSIKMNSSNNGMNRINSGLSIKEVYNRSMNSQYYYGNGRSRQNHSQNQQAPWSRHTEDDSSW